ncbi:MAG: phage baseplate assembly protein V [Pseudomonadota bacterium]
MFGEFIQTIAGDHRRRDKRIQGVTLATVVSNQDMSGQGRVQIRVPSMPNYQPWARVAAFSAGRERGGYFIPQQGEEVLVAFNQGDVREPYVLGTLWNGQDKPPFTGPMDPTQKRAIRTPIGHEVLLDDAEQKVVVKTSTGQTITLTPDSIEIAAGDAAKITLSTSGTVTIEASVQIEFKAPAIKANATSSLDLKASVVATLDGGANCTVKGGLVNIN